MHSDNKNFFDRSSLTRKTLQSREYVNGHPQLTGPMTNTGTIER